MTKHKQIEIKLAGPLARKFYNDFSSEMQMYIRRTYGNVPTQQLWGQLEDKLWNSLYDGWY
jgi:hypothetical protein